MQIFYSICVDGINVCLSLQNSSNSAGLDGESMWTWTPLHVWSTVFKSRFHLGHSSPLWCKTLLVFKDCSVFGSEQLLWPCWGRGIPQHDADTTKYAPFMKHYSLKPHFTADAAANHLSFVPTAFTCRNFHYFLCLFLFFASFFYRIARQPDPTSSLLKPGQDTQQQYRIGLTNLLTCLMTSE